MRSTKDFIIAERKNADLFADGIAILDLDMEDFGRGRCIQARKREAFEVTSPGPCLPSSAPPPGLAFGEPDDRLRRGIQYAAASRLNRRSLEYCIARFRGR